mgnify:CR=1 FL=1
MMVSIHQPSYLPYLGVIEKALKSDIFVLYDTAQYSKEYFHNRNFIISNIKKTLLTIPVNNNSWKIYFKDVNINNKNQIKKHFKSIVYSYSKCKFYQKYIHKFEQIYNNYKKYDKLIDITIPIIKEILNIFNYKGIIVLASELNYDTNLKSTDALVAICKKLNATEYIAGSGGKGYIDEHKFKDANIRLLYQDFKCLPYNQFNCDDFIPYLNTLDYIFNCGNDSSVFSNSFQ